MLERQKKNKSDFWKIIAIAIVSIIIISATLWIMTEKKQQAGTTTSNTPEITDQPEKNQEDNRVEKPIEEEEQKHGDEQNESKGQKPANGENVQPKKEQPKQPDQQEMLYDESGYPLTHVEPTEPTFVKGVLIANKQYPLPKTYNPGESPEARAALDKMIASAKSAGFELVAFSGFRTYEYQQNLYTNYVSRDGKKAADRYSARPGYSEHQTGMTYDIGEKGNESVWLTSEFGETPAGKWLHTNAHKFGFILRYPDGKEDITGYMYESWHFRYVGEKIAKAVFEADTTLEEYLKLK